MVVQHGSKVLSGTKEAPSKSSVQGAVTAKQGVRKLKEFQNEVSLAHMARTYTKYCVFGVKVVAAKEVAVVGVPEPVGAPEVVVITYS